MAAYQDGVCASSEQIPDEKPTETIKKRTICRFYFKIRGCRLGEKCRFVHLASPDGGRVAEKEDDLHITHSGETPEIDEKEQATPINSDGRKGNPEVISGASKKESKVHLGTESSPTALENDKEPKPKVRNETRCRFLSSKTGCKRGENCRFSHVKVDKKNKPKLKPTRTPLEYQAEVVNETNTTSQISEESDDIDKQSSKKTISGQSGPHGFRPLSMAIPTTKRLSALGEAELEKLRSRELGQLRRKFGEENLKILQEIDGTTYKVEFYPSDPDWPFDVESISLLVMFPSDYPKQLFQVSLSIDQDLPAELISYVNHGITKWQNKEEKSRNKRDTVDLPFRPFLRWLDRTLENLFINAGKQMRRDEETKAGHLTEAHSQPNQNSPSTESKKYIKEIKTVASSHKKTSSSYHQRTPKDSESYYSSSERREILLSDFLASKRITKEKAARKDYHDKTTQRDTLVITKSPPTLEYTETFGGPNKETASGDNILGACKSVDGDEATLSQKHIRLWSDQEYDCTSDRHFEVDSTLGVFDGVQSSDDIEPSRNREENTSSSRGTEIKPTGTEIRFKGLEMTENTSTITANVLALTMECGKCKTKIDAKVDKSKSLVTRCEKCVNVQSLAFRPSIIHQYSFTLGYLDLDGWRPFDLIMSNTQLMVGCLYCSKETALKDLHYGENQSWCGKCHQKLNFKVECTRFYQLQPTGAPSEASKLALLAEKPKRQPKTPGLKEGFPLPDNGTCKHYKKSFRWLRFPCCGKCFPCDVCHEENESHEMTFASRMVCGYCSKEQPYSQNTCTNCKSSLTKTRTSHWEGGKGCRDKITMSKGDDRKFKNTMKTVSRKSEKMTNPKGKSK